MIAILGLQDACLDSLARSISILIIIRGLMREVVGIKLTDIISPAGARAPFLPFSVVPDRALGTRQQHDVGGEVEVWNGGVKVHAGFIDNLRFACPLSPSTLVRYLGISGPCCARMT